MDEEYRRSVRDWLRAEPGTPARWQAWELPEEAAPSLPIPVPRVSPENR
ncbi:hypothetical protein [Amycolatopsis samaneae]|uniref:Uncharacterized protein n=1 Tax=Amycolatopsis samaneae TaxID=664691 RepID=A0ABW5GH16_9PSEU